MDEIARINHRVTREHRVNPTLPSQSEPLLPLKVSNHASGWGIAPIATKIAVHLLRKQKL
jgi:hypothetical protein